MGDSSSRPRSSREAAGYHTNRRRPSMLDTPSSRLSRPQTPLTPLTPSTPSLLSPRMVKSAPASLPSPPPSSSSERGPWSTFPRVPSPPSLTDSGSWATSSDQQQQHPCRHNLLTRPKTPRMSREPTPDVSPVVLQEWYGDFWDDQANGHQIDGPRLESGGAGGRTSGHFSKMDRQLLEAREHIQRQRMSGSQK